MKDPVLIIAISHEDGADKLNVQLTGSANIALGMIARARYVLSELESDIYADIKDKVENNAH